MNELTLNGLVNSFNSQWAAESAFVGVVIKIPGNTGNEVIINPASEYEKKLEYYKKTYDDNLEHRHVPGLQIVGWAFGNSFADIQYELGV